MKTGRKFLLGAAIAAIALSAGACGKSEDKKTVGEKVGGAVDKAVDQAGQVMEKGSGAMLEPAKR